MSGPQCCENPPALSPSSGAGHAEQLGGLDTYVVGLQDSKHAIILLSDIFGYEAPNFRKLADKVAAAGFYVVAPDYFYGDAYAPENAERPIPVWVKDHGVKCFLPLEVLNFEENAHYTPKRGVKPRVGIFYTTEESGFDDTIPVIEALKSKGISKIGAAGFCWGGKGVVELAKRELIQAGVLLHPALFTPDDIKGVKVPIAVLGAEIDETAPPELLKQFEEVLAAKSEVDGFVKVFPKTTHGWTVRYKDEDKAAAEEAHSDMIQWFVKYVK